MTTELCPNKVCATFGGISRPPRSFGLMHHETKKWRKAMHCIFGFAVWCDHASGTHQRRQHVQHVVMVFDLAVAARKDQLEFAVDRAGDLPFPQCTDQFGGERNAASPSLGLRHADFRKPAAARAIRLFQTSDQRSPRNSDARSPVSAAVSSRARCCAVVAAASSSRRNRRRGSFSKYM
jgi:hypothetical protein